MIFARSALLADVSLLGCCKFSEAVLSSAIYSTYYFPFPADLIEPVAKPSFATHVHHLL